jgi:hypothetical protein
LKEKGATEFDMGTLRELMSYEMLMELAVQYLRKEKNRRRKLMKRSMEIGPQIVAHKDDDLEINLYQLNTKRTCSE